MKSYLPKLYFNKYTTVLMQDNQSISLKSNNFRQIVSSENSTAITSENKEIYSVAPLKSSLEAVRAKSTNFIKRPT